MTRDVTDHVMGNMGPSYMRHVIRNVIGDLVLAMRHVMTHASRDGVLAHHVNKEF
jgi:tRNA U38,U39,U40 pseudouridine synthase TruA